MYHLCVCCMHSCVWCLLFVKTWMCAHVWRECAVHGCAYVHAGVRGCVCAVPAASASAPGPHTQRDLPRSQALRGPPQPRALPCCPPPQQGPTLPWESVPRGCRAFPVARWETVDAFGKHIESHSCSRAPTWPPEEGAASMAGPHSVFSPPSPCRPRGKPYQLPQLSCLGFLTYKVAIITKLVSRRTFPEHLLGAKHCPQHRGYSSR